MKDIKTLYQRSNLVESSHNAKVLIKRVDGRVILSTGNENDYIYPRSSIKIFQALPFVESKAVKKFKLSLKTVALACSSHRGEKYHIKEINNWLKKINVKEKVLKCGSHYPLNDNEKVKILSSNKKIDQRYNNCAGKHLAMITSCLINNYNLNSYLAFEHPHQKKIRKIFEKFSNTKIKKENYGIDGCSAPQYSFQIKNISNMLCNLIKAYDEKFYYNSEVKFLINCIIKNPKYIGGTDSLDSRIMSICNEKVFCKGGAEGVFLFTHLKKRLTGVIKIEDGNERAIPPIIYDLFKKYKILILNELRELKKFYNFNIYNHAKVKIGSIKTNL